MTNFSIDVGGSLVRLVANDNPTIVKYDSEFAILPDDVQIMASTPSKDSTAIIKFCGQDYSVVKGRSMNLYQTVPKTCDNSTLKTDFIGTYLNILYAIGRYALKEGQAIVHARAGVCLPPSEVYRGARDRFVANLAGEHVIDFPLLNERITIVLKKSDIVCVAEGIAACLSIQDQAALNRVSKGSVILIDVGFRSTEIAVFRNGDIYRGAFDSKPIGGINTEAMLHSALEKKGMFRDKDEIRNILAHGVISAGSTQHPIGSVVLSIKRKFAETLRTNVLSVFNAAGLNLSSANYFLPIGRPFLETGKRDTDTFGGSLIDLLSEQLGIEAIRISNIEDANVIGAASLLNVH